MHLSSNPTSGRKDSDSSSTRESSPVSQFLAFAGGLRPTPRRRFKSPKFGQSPSPSYHPGSPGSCTRSSSPCPSQAPSSPMSFGDGATNEAQSAASLFNFPTTPNTQAGQHVLSPPYPAGSAYSRSTSRVMSPESSIKEVLLDVPTTPPERLRAHSTSSSKVRSVTKEPFLPFSSPTPGGSKNRGLRQTRSFKMPHKMGQGQRAFFSFFNRSDRGDRKEKRTADNDAAFGAPEDHTIFSTQGNDDQNQNWLPAWTSDLNPTRSCDSAVGRASLDSYDPSKAQRSFPPSLRPSVPSDEASTRKEPLRTDSQTQAGRQKFQEVQHSMSPKQRWEGNAYPALVVSNEESYPYNSFHLQKSGFQNSAAFRADTEKANQASLATHKAHDVPRSAPANLQSFPRLSLTDVTTERSISTQERPSPEEGTSFTRSGNPHSPHRKSVSLEQHRKLPALMKPSKEETRSHPVVDRPWTHSRKPRPKGCIEKQAPKAGAGNDTTPALPVLSQTPVSTSDCHSRSQFLPANVSGASLVKQAASGPSSAIHPHTNLSTPASLSSSPPTGQPSANSVCTKMKTEETSTRAGHRSTTLNERDFEPESPSEYIDQLSLDWRQAHLESEMIRLGMELLTVQAQRGADWPKRSCPCCGGSSDALLAPPSTYR